MNNKMDDFKEFVRNNNHLISYIKNGSKSWQDFYEIYDLYGEDERVWNEYLKDDSNNRGTRSGNYIDDMIRVAKNIDVDKVQEGITSLQKTLGLFGDLFINKKNGGSKEYNPRPLYRRFED